MPLQAILMNRNAYKIIAIFHDCKNDNFQMKNRNVFLILAQNTDCGYTLESPH